MKKLVMAALTLMSLPGIGHSETPAEVAARLVGHPPEKMDDYFAIKQQLGDDGVWAVRDALSNRARADAGVPAEGIVAGCRMPDWLFQESAGFELALASADAKAWQDNLIRVEMVESKRDAIHDRVKAGEAADPVYAGAAAAFKQAAEENDRRKAELARRVGEDQFQRADGQISQTRSLWAAEVTPALDGYYREAGTGEMCRVDRANTEWLKTDLAANGWPRISVYGPGPDMEAWLLVQHADHDVPFQKSVLAMLEALLPAKDTAVQNYALLYDRVAVAEKRPQRYGTQGRCVGPAHWEPYASEDPDNLDKRRSEVGLNSEAEYKKVFTFCTAELAAMSGG
ncbi:MAG: hypothetical protein JF615_08350 [Asticcacaulis sp.]|nr:hypothetical protein [Asticcacaulis sp.]